MPVKFTADAEKERIAQKSVPTWGLYSGTSLPDVLHRARDMGWFEAKVQVRAEGTASDVTTFIIEPYEEGCGCSGILRYSDYFDPPPHG